MAVPLNAWNKCDETMATQLTACTYNPGHVYPFPTDALPQNMQQGMPGLQDAYVSGYCNQSEVSENFTALGEFAVARTESDLGKGYNYAFGVSSDGDVYFAGPYKSFAEHHWASSEPTPVSALFGYSGHYYSTTSSVQPSS
jgi:hypothetical protein